MIKNNVKIKDKITFKDEINAIEYITASNFTIYQETGEVIYTPEYEMPAEFEAIVLYFIDGIEFEKDEIMYEQITKDSELSKLIMRFYPKDDEKENEKNSNYISIRNFVTNNVHKKVEFTLQQLIHKNPVADEFTTLLSQLTNIIVNFDLSNLSKLKELDIKAVMNFMQNLSNSKITESSITKALKNVIKFDDKTAELIDAKNSKIKSLQMRINQLEGK